MRFYYFSLLSWAVYVVYGAIAITLVSLLWTKLLKLRLRNPAYWVLAIVILAAPWMEELWIAYNFDRLCRKDAGVFIEKVVQVEGFYDDTSGWGPRQLAESDYRFVESRDILKNRLIRVERADDAARNRALAWYAKTNPGKERASEHYLVYAVNDNEQVVVSPNGVDAWRVTKLDKPSARYQYKTLNSHTPVAHQIKRFENVVLDGETGEVLGRYANYHRGSYWFFVSSGAPTIPCEEAEAGVRKHGTLSVFALTLKPSK